MAGERDIRLEKLWINRCCKKKKKKSSYCSVLMSYTERGGKRRVFVECATEKVIQGTESVFCIWVWFLVYFHLVCFLLPGKLKRLSRWPLGEGLGGGVALGGLLCWKGAGEEGVDEVVEDGLLLESSWFSTGG